MNDAELRARLQALAEQRLASRPGAIGRFREFLASEEGTRAFPGATIRGIQRIDGLLNGEYVGANTYDEHLIAFVDRWAAATEAPDVQPLPARTEPANECAARTEPAIDRAARRLARLREFGGDMREAGSAWHCTGRRGALADLVREEKAAGRPRSDNRDVRRDLADAMRVQRGS